MTGGAASSRPPGRLTIDLGALADNWRTLARARRARAVRGRRQGQRLWDRPCRSCAGALGGRRARFLRRPFERGGRGAPALLPEAAIYVLNGLESARRPGGLCAPSPRAGHRRRRWSLARWSAFAARSGRTSPCALHLDTGMNRLGFESLARLRAAMEADGAASGADLLMSHFVSSEFADDPINAAQIERFDAARAAFPSLPASLANSSGMFLSPRPILRPGAARLCALWRQSDAGRRQPDAPRRDARRRHPADPLDRGGHDLRLQRPVDRQAPHAACDPARRLRRRPAARRGRDGCKGGRRGRDRRPPLPAGRAGVDGPDHR